MKNAKTFFWYALVITIRHINENQYGIMVYRLDFHPWKLRLQPSILQGQWAKGPHEEETPLPMTSSVFQLAIFSFFHQRPNRKSKSQYSKSVLCFKSIDQICSKAEPNPTIILYYILHWPKGRPLNLELLNPNPNSRQFSLHQRVILSQTLVIKICIFIDYKWTILYGLRYVSKNDWRKWKLVFQNACSKCI